MSISEHTTTAAVGGAALLAGRHCRHELLLGTCCWCPAENVNLTLPATSPTMDATVVVTAWYPTLCRNPGCGHRSDVGDPVGLVAEVGPCCATCIGQHPDDRGGPDDRRGWVA